MKLWEKTCALIAALVCAASFANLIPNGEPRPLADAKSEHAVSSSAAPSTSHDYLTEASFSGKARSLLDTAGFIEHTATGDFLVIGPFRHRLGFSIIRSS
jgi:hypothetical protein